MGRMAPNNAVMWWCYGAEYVQGAQSTSSIQAKTRVFLCGQTAHSTRYRRTRCLSVREEGR